MSNQPGTLEPTKAELRADAQAEKARAKALRPWFKKKRFVLPLALVAIIVVAQIANPSSDDNTSATSQNASVDNGGTSSEIAPGAEAPAAEEPAAPGIGATLNSDDGVSATLTSLEYGVAAPNDFIIDPKGSLAAVAMDMSNGSTEKISLSGSSVIAFVGDIEYEAAALLGPNGEWYVYEDINPGLATPFTAYFDLPADVQITDIEFRSSMFDLNPLTFTI